MDIADIVERAPLVAGGQTVMKGTRIPLRTVLASLADGDTVDQILADFPTLRREHINATIAFAASSALEDQPVPRVPDLP